jgi:hypothetical protein
MHDPELCEGLVDGALDHHTGGGELLEVVNDLAVRRSPGAVIGMPGA